MTEHHIGRGDVPTPERSLEQRRAALATANRIRTARARVKRVLGGDRRLLEALLILDLDAFRNRGVELERGDLDSMRLIEALVATPKIGRVKANRTLTTTRISPSKTLGGLTIRQRRELLVELGFSRPPAPVTALDEEEQAA